MQPNDYAFDQLWAQRDAAYWAGVSAVAAWVAIFINGVALALVYLQLRSNAQAVRASTDAAEAATQAAKIAQADARPWVQVTAHVRRSTQDDILYVHATAKNIGRLPALDVNVTIMNDLKKGENWAMPGPPIFFNQPPLFPDQEMSGRVESIKVERHGPELHSKMLLAQADYLVPGDPVRKRTAVVFQARARDGALPQASPMGWVRNSSLVT